MRTLNPDDRVRLIEMLESPGMKLEATARAIGWSRRSLNRAIQADDELLAAKARRHRVPTTAIVDSRDYSLAEQLAGQGWNMRIIAKRLGLGDGAFRRLMREDEHLSAAIAQGRAVMERSLVDSLYRRAVDLKHPQGAISAMFLLKSMFHFRDQGPTEGDSSKVAVVVNIPAPLSEEDYRRLIEVHPRLLPVAAPVVKGDADGDTS